MNFNKNGVDIKPGVDALARDVVAASDRGGGRTHIGVDAIVRACQLVDPVPLPLARLAFRAGCIGRVSRCANVRNETIETLLSEVRSMIRQRQMPDYPFPEDAIASLLGSRWRRLTLDWALPFSTSVAFDPTEPLRPNQDFFAEFETRVGLMALASTPRMSTRLRAWSVSSLGQRPDALFSLMTHVQLPASILRRAFPRNTLGEHLGDLLIYQRAVLRDPEWVATLVAGLRPTARADLPRLAMARLTGAARTSLAREYFEVWVSTDANTANQFFGEFSGGPEGLVLTRAALLRILALPGLDVCTRELIMRRYLPYAPADTAERSLNPVRTRTRPASA